MTPPDSSSSGRVRITSPLAGAPAPQRRSARQEIDESTTVGAVYVRSLVRSQRRAALTTAAAAMITIGLMPIVFWADLPMHTWSVAGVPAVWWVLGVGVYPWVWWLGRIFVWRAERNETIFAALMESPTDPEDGPP